MNNVNKLFAGMSAAAAVTLAAGASNAQSANVTELGTLTGPNGAEASAVVSNFGTPQQGVSLDNYPSNLAPNSKFEGYVKDPATGQVQKVTAIFSPAGCPDCAGKWQISTKTVTAKTPDDHPTPVAVTQQQAANLVNNTVIKAAASGVPIGGDVMASVGGYALCTDVAQKTGWTVGGSTPSWTLGVKTPSTMTSNPDMGCLAITVKGDIVLTKIREFGALTGQLVIKSPCATATLIGMRGLNTLSSDLTVEIPADGKKKAVTVSAGQMTAFTNEEIANAIKACPADAVDTDVKPHAEMAAPPLPVAEAMIAHRRRVAAAKKPVKIEAPDCVRDRQEISGLNARLTLLKKRVTSCAANPTK